MKKISKDPSSVKYLWDLFTYDSIKTLYGIKFVPKIGPERHIHENQTNYSDLIRSGFIASNILSGSAGHPFENSSSCLKPVLPCAVNTNLEVKRICVLNNYCTINYQEYIMTTHNMRVPLEQSAIEQEVGCLVNGMSILFISRHIHLTKLSLNLAILYNKLKYDFPYTPPLKALFNRIPLNIIKDYHYSMKNALIQASGKVMTYIEESCTKVLAVQRDLMEKNKPLTLEEVKKQQNVGRMFIALWHFHCFQLINDLLPQNISQRLQGANQLHILVPSKPGIYMLQSNFFSLQLDGNKMNLNDKKSAAQKVVTMDKRK